MVEEWKVGGRRKGISVTLMNYIKQKTVKEYIFREL